jgi:hypothetical protein
MQRMLAIRHHRTRGLKKPELDEELIKESDQNHPIESRGPSRPMVLQTIVEREPTGSARFFRRPRLPRALRPAHRPCPLPR